MSASPNALFDSQDNVRNVHHHLTQVSVINQELLNGNYRNISIWSSILNLFRISKWEEPGSEHIKNVLQNVIEQCEEGIISEDSNAKTLRAYIYIDEGEAFFRAINLLNQAISQGNRFAMTIRARIHQYGLDGDINYPAAIKLYEQAIELEEPSAMFERACLHENGQPDTIDYPAAIKLLDRAINEHNHAPSMYRRACMYLSDKREDGSVDYPAAIDLLERAIALNEPQAMHLRANLHQRGEGGSKDISAANALYMQAALLGHAESLYLAAMVLLSNTEFASTPAVIDDFLKKASDLGHADATYCLANRYLAHHPCTTELKSKAIRLYRQAAELDHEQARNNLQKQQDICGNYHKAMLERDYTKVTEVILKEAAAFNEFLEFDWQRLLDNQQLYDEQVTEVLKELVKTIPNKLATHEKQIQMLSTLARMEQEKDINFQELQIILLSGINFSMLEMKHVETIANIIVDTWFKIEEADAKKTYSVKATRFLAELFWKQEPVELLKQYSNASFIKIADVIVRQARGMECLPVSANSASLEDLVCLAIDFAIQSLNINPAPEKIESPRSPRFFSGSYAATSQPVEPAKSSSPQSST